MQNAVPKGEGGMLAVLGSTASCVDKILIENEHNFKAEIANDNSENQIVLSGRINDLEKLIEKLNEKKNKEYKTSC